MLTASSIVWKISRPTISAVNGYALGGGCECVLATDYRWRRRICALDCRKPLGIMPGFGGSVRLPRLLGADSALEIIAAGKDVGADQALKIGSVDGVVAAENYATARWRSYVRP